MARARGVEGGLSRGGRAAARSTASASQRTPGCASQGFTDGWRGARRWWSPSAVSSPPTRLSAP